MFYKNIFTDDWKEATRLSEFFRGKTEADKLDGAAELLRGKADNAVSTCFSLKKSCYPLSTDGIYCVWKYTKNLYESYKYAAL